MSEEFNKGPDQMKQTDNVWTIDVEDVVKLRIAKEGVGARKPISIPGLFKKIAEDYGNHPALRYKVNNTWETITYSEYKDRVFHMAKVFIKLGLKPRHSVAILGFNSKEWFISALAAIHAGGISTGIYPTNSPEAVHHILESSRADIIVVDELKQYEKILKIKDKLPNLKAVIQVVEPFGKNEPWYYNWNDLEKISVDEYQNELEDRLSKIVINECCLLIYTSGTVGAPKGVMISHDNLTFNSYIKGMTFPKGLKMAKEVIVTYLPLSHVAAHILDIYIGITFAATVYFADKDALKSSLVQTLKEARPTVFLGVPRVFEKIQEKIMAAGSESGGLKKMVSDWAKGVALHHNMEEMEGRQENSWQYSFVKNFILSKVKTALGLENCVALYSGAAPISDETKKYFMSLDIIVLDAFGMSETSGAHMITNFEAHNFKTVGRPMGSYEVTLGGSLDENRHGEILMRGRNIFMGYINDLEKTEEAIDDEGWIHSGDLGYIDENGMVYVTGRIKELLITAGGENIPPVPIEDAVKHELPVISNAMLIGDKRKFLSLLVTLKTRIDSETGAPMDDLRKETMKWLKELGLEYTKLSEILQAGPDPKVMKAIEDGIVKVNKTASSNAQKIQKFAILPHDFSIPTGELGPTLKLKRNIVAKMYSDIIENFYKV